MKRKCKETTAEGRLFIRILKHCDSIKSAMIKIQTDILESHSCIPTHKLMFLWIVLVDSDVTFDTSLIKLHEANEFVRKVKAKILTGINSLSCDLHKSYPLVLRLTSLKTFCKKYTSRTS